ncbi:54S ribosomal protein L25, mitochondrial [Erysiphe necator]|uniref:Putative diphthamide biosynthesis protein 4 protein n=1 Tax=Uncinula necator TaxID=52586 RepID=A0A0B1P1F7_UNCNE|nr:54S ribosomal protein L25, mitochondrial [Erysiphe necator]KHJ32068.1 putative diphthamide biosynthesis protein 4 protein [Erysiphe necator]
MAKSQELINLAKSLPPKLSRFFARYPPLSIIPPNYRKDSSPQPKYRFINPFKATRDPNTNRWHDPTFSLRRQADLVKLAREHGVEDLLPYTVKGTKAKIRRKMKHGSRIKGTGAGQNVKGKESERTMKARLEMRKQAMLAMPQMIKTWKERGHGRGWKSWPK